MYGQDALRALGDPRCSIIGCSWSAENLGQVAKANIKDVYCAYMKNIKNRRRKLTNNYIKYFLDAKY